MRVSLVLFLVLLSLCQSQKHYYDDFYSLRQAAPKVPADKIKKMIAHLNKEKLDAEEPRITNFINANVAKSARSEQKEIAFKQLESINNMKQFTTGLYTAIKKTKVVNPKKLAEMRDMFDSLDYNLKHQLNEVLKSWISRLQDQEVIPNETFAQINATIFQYKATWEKKNPSLSQILFP